MGQKWWGFEGVTPLPQFFRSPHLPKINPANRYCALQGFLCVFFPSSPLPIFKLILQVPWIEFLFPGITIIEDWGRRHGHVYPPISFKSRGVDGTTRHGGFLPAEIRRNLVPNWCIGPPNRTLLDMYKGTTTEIISSCKCWVAFFPPMLSIELVSKTAGYWNGGQSFWQDVRYFHFLTYRNYQLLLLLRKDGLGG